MSAPVQVRAPIVPGVIHAGDYVVAIGDPEFARAMQGALGGMIDLAFNADRDHPDADTAELVLIYPDAGPENLEENRAILTHVSETGQAREFLLRTADVVIDAESPTFARVLRARSPDAQGRTLCISGGRVLTAPPARTGT